MGPTGSCLVIDPNAQLLVSAGRDRLHRFLRRLPDRESAPPGRPMIASNPRPAFVPSFALLELDRWRRQARAVSARPERSRPKRLKRSSVWGYMWG
jgi:hypothetical protein